MDWTGSGEGKRVGVGVQGLRMGCGGVGDDCESAIQVDMYFKEEEELTVSNSAYVVKEDREPIVAFRAVGNLSNSSFQDMVETNT